MKRVTSGAWCALFLLAAAVTRVDAQATSAGGPPRVIFQADGNPEIGTWEGYRKDFVAPLDEHVAVFLNFTGEAVRERLVAHILQP